jgi:uncharacterized protein (UPF0335 family)
MTLERETLTISHDGGSITITGDEIKDVTASLRSLAENAEDSALKATVNRILFLMQEMRAIRDDIATVYNNAKGDGYNIKALRLLIRLMDIQTDDAKRNELLEVSGLLQVYANHVGQPLLPGMTL